MHEYLNHIRKQRLSRLTVKVTLINGFSVHLHMNLPQFHTIFNKKNSVCKRLSACRLFAGSTTNIFEYCSSQRKVAAPDAFVDILTSG